MQKQKIGIITCASILDQVKACPVTSEHKIYPLAPCCLFSISPDLLKHIFNEACLNNDGALLIYGNCHPKLQQILAGYEDRIIKLKGDNCWEMMLGAEIAQDYLAKGEWLVKNTLCTSLRKEVFASYGANRAEGNLIHNCHTKKIIAYKFEPDNPREEEVASFAKAFDVPFEIKEGDISSFNDTLLHGLDSVKELISRDITIGDKRILARNELKESAVSEAYFKLDVVSNELLFISPQITHLLGYTPAEFEYLYMSDHEGTMYADKETYLRVSEERFTYFSKCLMRGIQQPASIEYQVRHKNQTKLWLRESFQPKYDDDGTFVPYFTGKLENITVWKEAEDHLQKSYEKELQLRVALEKEAQKRIYFTWALVHELRTPLTPIILASDALHSVAVDNKLKSLVNNINNGASELNTRISELLDLARGEVGILKFVHESFDFNAVIREISEFFMPEIRLHEQKFSVKLESGLPEVSGDRGRIKQVVSNLLENAIKYSGNGSEINIQTALAGQEFLFTISDSGPGIPEDKLENIFDPYRCGNELHPSGLGLGLALSKMIIEKHSGKIWVSSVKNSGCSFSFTLPKV